MEKDADAYRTISEVSEALNIPPHVLRFWETKFPQVKPLKRGGGRRYYRRADTDLLRSIRRLLYDEGYTIRGVQRLLKTQGVNAVASLAKDQHTPMADQDASAPLAAAMPEEEDDISEGDPSGDRDQVRPGSLTATLAFIAGEIEACRAILDEASRAAQG